jgi:hypothetical protein
MNQLQVILIKHNSNFLFSKIGLDSSTARNVMEYLHQLSRKDRMFYFDIFEIIFIKIFKEQ